MSEPAIVASYRRAFARCGVPVTVQRVSGYAPNVTTVSAVSVTGVVRNVTFDANATAEAGLRGAMMGSIEQGDRLVMVLADDLAAAGFPVPVRKGDQVVLPESSEILNVLRVDPYKRNNAGAVELTVVGVS